MSQQALKIEGTEKMSELLSRWPGAKRALFAAYHIGGCSSCAYGDDETLAEVCLRNQLDPDEVISTLQESESNDRAMMLTPERAFRLLGEGFKVFDVRTREEFDAVSIESALFLDQQLENELMAGPKSNKLIFCDHKGFHALDKVAWFRGHGFSDVFCIDGGIDAWAREVDPKMPRYSIEFE